MSTSNSGITIISIFALVSFDQKVQSYIINMLCAEKEEFGLVIIHLDVKIVGGSGAGWSAND
jgi:hypothetical protein